MKKEKNREMTKDNDRNFACYCIPLVRKGGQTEHKRSKRVHQPMHPDGAILKKKKKK